MPVYEYIVCGGWPDETEERNVSISERDNQVCNRCGTPLQRKISFTGLTWSPTRNGGYS